MTFTTEIGKARARKEDARLVTGQTNWTDNIQLPGLVHVAAYRHRSVAADRDQRIDSVLLEAAKQLFGSVDLDPGAIALLHRVGRRVATIGSAEDRATLVDDAANPVTSQLDQPTIGIVVREQQPVETVADPDDIPVAVSRGQGGRMDDGVKSRRVTTAGAQSDPFDRRSHGANPTPAKHSGVRFRSGVHDQPELPQV